MIETKLSWENVRDRLNDSNDPLRHLICVMRGGSGINVYNIGTCFNLLQGMLLMAEDPPDFKQAQDCFHESIQGNEEVGAVVPAAQARYYLARMLGRQGDVGRAREILTELSSHFQDWGIPVWQQKCEQELEALDLLDKSSPAIKTG